MTTDELTNIVRMYGYDITFHYRPDGRVDTLSGYMGEQCIAHIYSDGDAAVKSMWHMVKSVVRTTVRQIEGDKKNML